MRRLAAFLIALVVVALVGYSVYSSRPSFPDRGVLVLKLGGELEELPAVDAVARLTARGPALPTLLLQLEKAAVDPQIVGVLVHIRPLQIGYARIQELRDAVERLRGSGKPVVAFLDVASFNATREVYLASAADQTWVTAAHLGPLAGIAGEYLFFGGLLEQIGVQFEYERIGKYKSAPESFAGREMSEPAREVANSLLDGLYDQVVAGVAEGRGLSEETVRSLVEDPPSTARDFIDTGLADGVASRADVVEQSGLADVEEVEVSDYVRLDPSDLGLRDGPAIALVFGDGTIVQGAGGLRGPRFAADPVIEALEQAAENDEVRAIVLRVNSPGGSAQASDALWQAVREARRAKPVVVSMADAAASGGYYLASAADAIVAEPATFTGSIGVFVARPSLEGLYEKLDIGSEVLTRGRFSEIGALSTPMSSDMRARTQHIVQSLYREFLERVSSGRGMDTERIDGLGQGRVWLGEAARDVGLVDELGGLYAAIARAKAEAGIEPEIDPRRIVYPGPRSFGEQLREFLRVRATALVADELGLPQIPGAVQAWLTTLDEPFAYLPPFWLEIH